MFNSKLQKIGFGLAIAGLASASLLAFGPKLSSVNGQGTLYTTNGSNGNSTHRTFSVSAQTRADGTVTGHAVLHNPGFTGDDDKKYYADIDISCMKVIGNTAYLGGMTRRTNDSNLLEAAFFSVQDNGEPGKGKDKISRVYFYDDDPNTTGDPAACTLIGPDDFPLETIENGNLQVK